MKLTGLLLISLVSFSTQALASDHGHSAVEHKSSADKPSKNPVPKADPVVLQEPPGCLEAAVEKGGCAFRTKDTQIFSYDIDDKTTLVLDHATTVIRVSKSKIRLISGTVWVKSQAAFEVESEFGRVLSQQAGEFFVTRSKDRVTAKATQVTLQLFGRGSKNSLEIQPGLQNFVGAIGLDGTAETGVPVAISFRDHLEQWARLYRGDKKTFEAQVDKFHTEWKLAAVESAEISKALFTRTVSSADEEAAAKAAAEAKVEAQRSAERRAFMKRVFDGL